MIPHPSVRWAWRPASGRPNLSACLDCQREGVVLVKVYLRETTEAFLDGHVSAFAFLGEVPRSSLYDSTTLAVARILGDGSRRYE